MNCDLDDLIQKLKIAFTNEEIKKNVLDDEWYVKNKNSKIDSTGFCFYANEVIYRFTGGKKKWILKRIPHWEHYFLFDKENKNILDITADQYGDTKIPYELGKGRGLQNKSKKAILLAKYIGIIL